MNGLTISLDNDGDVHAVSQKSAGIFAVAESNFANDVGMALYTRDSAISPYFTEKVRIKSTGNVGIGTSTPGSILSVQGVANWTSATSTYYATGGINLAAGCFAVSEICITGSGGSGTWPFTTGLSNFGVSVQATTTSLWFQSGLMASSTSYFVNASTTVLTVSGTGHFGTATTTSFYGAGLFPCTSGNFLTWTGGLFGCAADQTGSNAWPFTPTTFGATAANSTSTLIGFTNGIYSLASSTIGNGTQTGGLTISGGATTVFSASSTVSGLGNFLSNWAVGVDNLDGGKFKISSSSVIDTNDRFVIDGSGNVGIGTTSPWRKLSVTGTVGLDGVGSTGGTATLCLSDNKEVVTNNGACTSSSEFFKHDIMALSLSGIELVSALTPSSFVYNNDTSSTTRSGFIAQQLASTSPHFIDYYDAAGNPRTIDTTSILAVAVKAIQELIVKVQTLADSVAGFADHFTTKELTFNRAIGDEIDANTGKFKTLCVTDSNAETCITRTQLDALLQQAGQSPVAADPPHDPRRPL